MVMEGLELIRGLVLARDAGPQIKPDDDQGRRPLTAATAAGRAQRRSRSMIRSRPKVGVCYGACPSSP